MEKMEKKKRLWHTNAKKQLREIGMEELCREEDFMRKKARKQMKRGQVHCFKLTHSNHFILFSYTPTHQF